MTQTEELYVCVCICVCEVLLEFGHKKVMKMGRSLNKHYTEKINEWPMST